MTTVWNRLARTLALLEAWPATSGRRRTGSREEEEEDEEEADSLGVLEEEWAAVAGSGRP